MDKETVLLDSEERMEKAIATLEREFGRLRTGRASTNLVDNIKVDYYGTPTPISQLASVAVPDSRTITSVPESIMRTIWSAASPPPTFISFHLLGVFFDFIDVMFHLGQPV